MLSQQNSSTGNTHGFTQVNGISGIGKGTHMWIAIYMVTSANQNGINSQRDGKICIIRDCSTLKAIEHSMAARRAVALCSCGVFFSWIFYADSRISIFTRIFIFQYIQRSQLSTIFSIYTFESCAMCIHVDFFVQLLVDNISM